MAYVIVSLVVVTIIAVLANWLLVQHPPQKPSARRVSPAAAKPAKPPVPRVSVLSPLVNAGSGDLEHVSVLLIDVVTKERVRGGFVSLGTEKGTFDFVEVDSGQYDNSEIRTAGLSELNAGADGYETVKRHYGQLSPDIFPITIELVPLSTLRVFAKSEDGTPSLGAMVYVTLSWHAAVLRSDADGMDIVEHFQKPIEATTDAAGLAVFAELPFGGPYAIDVRAEGRGTVRKDGIHLAMGETSDVEVTLMDGVTLLGYTINSEGVRAEGYAVKCYRNSYEKPQQGICKDLEAWTVSDATGEFRLEGLLPGWKHVEVSTISAGRIEAFGFEITLKPGETYDCGEIGPLGLASGGIHLSGTVADEEGQPVPLCGLLIMGHDYPYLKLQGTVDEEGRFQIVGLSPGRMSLIVMPRNYGGQPPENKPEQALSKSPLGMHGEECVLRPGEKKELTIVVPYLADSRQGGRLVVRLRDAGTYIGRAAAVDFDLYLRDARSLRSYALSRCENEGSDAYILPVVAKSVYSILVIGEGKIGETAEITVSDDQETEAEVILEDGVEMRGRILDKQTGHGIQALVQRAFKVNVGHKSPVWFGAKPIRTEPTGEFVVRLFRHDELGKLNVRAVGYSGTSVEVTGAVGEIGDIFLERKQ